MLIPGSCHRALEQLHKGHGVKASSCHGAGIDPYGGGDLLPSLWAAAV